MAAPVPLRAWRARLPRHSVTGERSGETDGFVVDCGPSQEPVVTTLRQELPEGAWRDLHDYMLIDAAGTVVQETSVTTWSLEDDLGVSAYAVIDGALRNLNLTLSCGSPYRIRRSEETVADGLQAVASDDRGTAMLLTRALEQHGKMLAEAEARRARAASDRLTAIPGARDDYGIGDDFSRAQHLLGGRISAYGRQIDSTLLAALMRFGGLHRLLGSYAACGEGVRIRFAVALSIFVHACRLAAFDRMLSESRTAPVSDDMQAGVASLPVKVAAEWRELETALTALEKDLLQEAESQEWSDANLNAAQYRVAAGQVARARGTLEVGA